MDLEGNLSLIDAAKNAGVRHFIFVSAAAVDESSAVPLFAAKARTEKYLRESGMSWTIIAPHIFMDVWFPMIIGSALGAGRPVPLVGGGKCRHSFIAVEFVAPKLSRSVRRVRRFSPARTAAGTIEASCSQLGPFQSLSITVRAQDR